MPWFTRNKKGLVGNVRGLVGRKDFDRLSKIMSKDPKSVKMLVSRAIGEDYSLPYEKRRKAMGSADSRAIRRLMEDLAGEVDKKQFGHILSGLGAGKETKDAVFEEIWPKDDD